MSACCCCCRQSLDPAKYPLPEPYPYKEAAAFFAEPEVTPAEQLPPLKWSAPDEEGLIAFLVGESGRWLAVVGVHWPMTAATAQVERTGRGGAHRVPSG